MNFSPEVFLLLGLFFLFNSACNLATVVNDVVENTEKDKAELLAQESFSLSSIKSVNVKTSGGSISLNGDAEQEASLEMYVKSSKSRNLSKEELQGILERDYEIKIEERNGTLYAHATKKNKNSWDNTLSISFQIRTANKVNSEMITSGGSIRLSTLSGKQYFKTSGGSLKIDKVEGYIEGVTSGGSIKLSDAQGDIDLQTSGGSIKLDNVDGLIIARTSGGSIRGQQLSGNVSVKTSGGSIHLEDLACNLNASTSGGSVTADISTLTGDINLATSAGSVNLILPQNEGADLNLRGSKVNTSGLTNFQGSNSKGVLEGRTNGGGVNINATTSAGSVNVSVK